APNRDEAVAQLRKQRLNVLKIDEATKKKKGGKVPMRDIVIFTRQFSTMINAGLPLVQALDILATQSENQALKDTTKAVVFDVESGNTVADALRKHPNAFTELYVNMVAAGEAGGILDTILMRLAVFMEKNDALIRKVKGAMIYPGVIMSVAAIAITVLLVFVIPTFQTMFASANIAQPLPTRIVIGMSHFLRDYWYVIIIVVVAEFMEKNDALIRKVKGAMIYPGVIMSVAAIAITVLLVFVIPTFQTMFASANIALPLPTRIVIGMSHFLRDYWYVIIIVVVA